MRCRFTPLDLAAALEALTLQERRPGTRAVFLGLIHQSPEARAMFDALQAPVEEGGPTLLDLARVLLAADGLGIPGASRTTVRWLASQVPTVQGHLEELDQLSWTAYPWPPLFEVGYRALRAHEVKLDRQLWDPSPASDPAEETPAPLVHLALARSASARRSDKRRYILDVLSRLGHEPYATCAVESEVLRKSCAMTGTRLGTALPQAEALLGDTPDV